MKIFVQHQKGINFSIIETGIREAVRLLKDIGLNTEIIYKEVSYKLTTTSSKTPQGNEVVFVDPQLIIENTDISCNVSCLIYNWQGLVPQPTNPVQTPQFVRNFTPIQIPVQFYTNTTVTPHKHFPEVLTHYFLHEVAHALVFICNTRGLGIKDTVHDNLSIPHYLEIIKSLLPHRHLFSTATPPQRQHRVVNLGFGARGERVREVQQFLGIHADGIFGRQTRQAVLEFQRKHGIQQTGIVGTITFAKIEDLKKKPKVIIYRTKQDTVQTTGKLLAYRNNSTFSCDTLELGWRNNMRNVSCIPTGKYQVRWTLSPRFARFMYEVIAVPNRSGIRFHSANYHFELNGCIALGKHTDINKDGKLDTSVSRVTTKAFEDFMGKEGFDLEIVDNS